MAEDAEKACAALLLNLQPVPELGAGLMWEPDLAARVREI